jgi:Holliday junction resolvase RusA-like endonuclease
MNPYSFVAEGRPRSKQRPRMTRRGRTYTPAATLEAERILAEQYAGPLYEGPVAVTIVYEKERQYITITPVDWTSKLTGDVDNMVKLTLDALQKAQAFANDRQVVRIEAEKQ